MYPLLTAPRVTTQKEYSITQANDVDLVANCWI